MVLTCSSCSKGPQLDVNAIRERIVSMGEYGLVEGDGNLVKVHVHVPDPGAVLSYAVGLGFVTDVVVENMDDMSIPDMPAGYDPLPPRFQDRRRQPNRSPAAPPDEESAETVGVVVVAPGQGLARCSRAWAHKRLSPAARP